MTFPFKITKHYSLSDNDFGEYSTLEIIENIYNYLLKEDFKSIVKTTNEIEIIGNKDRRSRLMNWSKIDRITHCIDNGKITIINSPWERELIYTYQIKNFVLLGLIELISIPIIFGLMLWSLHVGIIFFWIILASDLIMWIFLIIVHPWTIEAPMEIMRTNSIRNKLKAKQ
jgi:hypothetical protein